MRIPPIQTSRWLLSLVCFVQLTSGTVAPASGRETKTASLIQVTFGPVAELAPACSPDGHWLAFEYFPRGESNGPEIWIMPTDSSFSSARSLVSDGLYHAGISWSPDSKWVSYTAASPDTEASGKGGLLTSQIYKISIDTLQIIQLTTLPKNTVIEDSTSWSSRGEIAFSMDDDIYAVRESGGDAYKVVDFHAIQMSARPPQNIVWSPDGKEIVFAAKDSLDSAENETATLWVAGVGTQRLDAILTHRQIGGVSWVGTKTLLLALARKEGTSQVYSLLLKTHDLKKLTAGPLDIWPCYAEQKELLFFNHAESSKPRFERSLVPSLHIWRQHFVEISK